MVERLQNHLCESYWPGEGFSHGPEPWMRTERCMKGLKVQGWHAKVHVVLWQEEGDSR